MEFGSIIKLNIGGTHNYSVSKDLMLNSESKLASIFSGKHKLKVLNDGRIFLDRNGVIFGAVLDFIRTD